MSRFPRMNLLRRKSENELVLTIGEVDKITNWFLLYDLLAVPLSDFPLVLEHFLGYTPSKLQIEVMVARAKKTTNEEGSTVITFDDVVTVMEARKRLIAYCLSKCKKDSRKKNMLTLNRILNAIHDSHKLLEKATMEDIKLAVKNGELKDVDGLYEYRDVVLRVL